MVRISIRIRPRVRVCVRFRVGVRDSIAIFLFLHNITAASANFYAGDFVMFYTSDKTNEANQSPSLNEFIGINFILI